MGIFSWIRKNIGGGGGNVARPERKFDYVMDTDGFKFSNISVGSVLGDGVAGSHGHLTTSGNKYVFEDGTEFKVYGTNVGKVANGPEKSEADSIARRLSALGFNCMRFHIMDTQRFLFENKDTNLQFNEDNVDKWMYFMSRLKAHGIYWNINLYVWRSYHATDPVPTIIYQGSENAFVPSKGVWVNYISEQVKLMEENHARMLLNRVNPYTGIRIADDPALAFVEIMNENMLFSGWSSGGIDYSAESKLDPTSYVLQEYIDELDDQFMDWLRVEYDNDGALVAAWGGSRETTPYGLRADESIATSVDRLKVSEIGNYTAARVNDMVRFYRYMETETYTRMRTYLRNLGVKCPVGTTQLYFGLPHLKAQIDGGDFQDVHAYWDHATFKGGDRTSQEMQRYNLSWAENPVLDDNPQITKTWSPFHRASLSAAKDTPLMISEWMGSKVNDYSHEAPIPYVVYSMFNGINALFQFKYAEEEGEYGVVDINDHLVSGNNPAFLALTTMCSLAYRRGDVTEAPEKINLNYTESEVDVAQTILNTGTYFWHGKTVPNWINYVVPVTKSIDDAGSDSGPTELLSEEDTGRYVSTTGEMVWDARYQDRACLKVDTGRFQALVGHPGGKSCSNISATANNRGVVGVISLNDNDISTSNRLLVVSVGGINGKGETWTEAGTWDIWDPGEQPCEITRVEGNLTISGITEVKRYRCYELDNAGRRGKEMSITRKTGKITIDIGRSDTPWFEVVKL